MKYDELKVCTRCESDACYTQEVTKDVSIEMCYGCGFQSNSIIKKGNEFFNQQFENLPELYKELMDEEEETGKIWMKRLSSILNSILLVVASSSKSKVLTLVGVVVPFSIPVCKL